MSGTPRRTLMIVLSLLTALAGLGLGGLGLAPAQAEESGAVVSYATPVEDYAGYQPQTRCIRKPRKGIRVLADWLVERGGSAGPISRSCAGSSRSEHKESRAFDWMLDARKRKDRRTAAAFLAEAFATDETGEPHALARRMGIMYVIWNDRIWSAYDGFEPERYLSSSCRSRRRCSTTLRHRDHMHVSLTRKAARGRTSWYVAQLTARAR